jgi:hypothetical protein
MPFTCEGAGSVWPDVAWCLAPLAPNWLPENIVSRANARTGWTWIPAHGWLPWSGTGL